jgi:uncharacterized membrane protein YccC
MSASAATLTTATPAANRILRLAIGTALAMAVSQTFNWPAAFIAPVLATVLLGLPIPAPSLAGGIKFIVALVAGCGIGFLILPALTYQPGAGVLMIVLGLLGCFYFQSRGGSPLLGTFALLGITIVPAIGSESIDLARALIPALATGAVVALPCVWAAHALFPEAARPADPRPEKPPAPTVSVAARNALRSTLVVMPVMAWFILVSGTSPYAAVLVKVASMGQQASADQSRSAGRDLLRSTLIGGAVAIAGWWIMKIWPNLLLLSLLTLLAGLLIGPRVFRGAALAPNAAVWSYGFTTAIVVLAPTLVAGPEGDAAGAKFFTRIVMFLIATLYAVFAVTVFDRWWPSQEETR